MKRILGLSLILSSLLASPAFAVVVSFELDPSPNNISNDCVGYYNQGGDRAFDNCVIFAEDDADRTDISSIIAKFNTDGSGWQTSGLYPGFDLSDLSLNYSGDGSTGSWTYANDATVGIRFWVVKSATGFIVNYETDMADCVGASLASTFSCMNSANVVYGGSWTTPSTRELSHISFYDSEIRVPEPGTLALLGLGLLGMGFRKIRNA